MKSKRTYNWLNISNLFDCLSKALEYIAGSPAPSILTKDEKYKIYKSPGFVLFRNQCIYKKIDNFKELWINLSSKNRLRYERVGQKLRNVNLKKVLQNKK
jgi:hypothetical protein